MKKLLLSLICVIAAGQLFAQRPNEMKLNLKPESQKQYIGDISVGYGCIVPFDMELGNLINLGYSVYLSPNFSLGGTFSWNALQTTLNSGDSFTALINAKYNWLNRRYVSLYSRVGLGFNTYNHSSSSNNTINVSNSTNFAFQATLFGVEAGKGFLRFYSEVGIGDTGCFEFGLRLKL